MKAVLFSISLWVCSAFLCAEDNYNQLVKDANGYFAQPNFDKAKEIYLEILKKKKDPIVLYNLGNVFLSTGDFDSALSKYHEAVEMKPEDLLLRNIHYHMGNAYLGKGRALIETDGVSGRISTRWSLIRQKINDCFAIMNTKNPSHLVLRNAFSELLDLKEFSQETIDPIVGKLTSVLENLEDNLKPSVKLILGEIESFKAVSSKEEKNKLRIDDLSSAISLLERSFNQYRRCLDHARKVGAEEGRNVVLVGRYAKNNWAIARKLWNQAYEELKALKKENLKLEEGVLQLLQTHEALFPQLEKIYLQSEEDQIVEYNMKVLAEFHQDYSSDLVALLAMSDDVLQKAKEELASLQNIAKAQASQNNLEEPEKSTEEVKLEEKIKNYEQISSALKSLQGIDQFVIEGLKNYDLFRTRKFSLQMKSVLHQINAFLKSQSTTSIFYDFIKGSSTKVETLMSESKKHSGIIQERHQKLAIENYLDNEFYLKQIEHILENEVKNISKEDLRKDLNSKSDKIGKIQKNEYESVIENLENELTKLNKKINEMVSLIDKNVLPANLVEKSEGLKTELRFVEFFHNNLSQIGSVQFLKCYQIINAKEGSGNIDLDLVFADGALKIRQWVDFSATEEEDSLKETKKLVAEKVNALETKYESFKKTPVESIRHELIESLLDVLLYLNPDSLFVDEIKSVNENWSKLLDKDKKKVEPIGLERALDSMGDLLNLYNKWLALYPEPDADAEKQIYRDRRLANSIISGLKENLTKYDENKTTESYHIMLHQLQYASALFLGQPQKAEDAIKLSLGIQHGLKDVATKIGNNEMKSFDDESLNTMIKYQTENMSLIGFRAVGLVNNEQEEANKQSEEPQGGGFAIPGMGGATSGGESDQIDYEKVKEHLKEAISYGEKIVSFNQAKEFINAVPQHDEMIKALEKALELFKKKNENQDGDKQQDQQNPEEGDQQQQQDQQQQDAQQDQAQEQKQEQKELSADEARQLLKDLNHKDDQRHEDKKEQKQAPNNTMRPW